MSGTWLREQGNMKQKFKCTITLWNTIWCACQGKNITFTFGEKVSLFLRFFLALSFGKLLVISGVFSSFSELKGFQCVPIILDS